MSVPPPQTVYQCFSRQAAAHGNAVAVRGLNAADLSYDGFMAQIDRVVEALSAWGIGRGDRVIIRLPNGPEPFVLMHGVAAVAVALLVDPNGSAVELEHFVRFVEPKAIILQQGVESVGRALAQQYGARVIEIIPTPEAGAGTFTFAEPPPPSMGSPVLNGRDDLAYLIGTSGTTALPKLVPKSQGDMLRTISFPVKTQYQDLGETIALQILNYMPMHMLFGSMSASTALASGGSVACLPGFDPQKFYQWLDVYRPYFVSAPPAMLEQILALASENQDILARHSIRYIYAGSSPLPEATRAELDRAFGVPVVQTYGMTEIGSIAQLILPAGSSAPSNSVGRATHVENTRIMASDGRFLPPGEAGEIVVKSDMFSGYWNNPEANEESFVDGWFRTGDEGFMDADANITIIGRFKEVINSGGAKVSPYEVEEVLRQHPQVKDAVVFGLGHREVGETVTAAVVGAVSERELRKFAAERLPFYKVPMRIILVDEIPKAASGKVQRNRIAELLGLK